MGAVKAVCTARDSARFTVETFGSAVREARGDVGNDALGVGPDRAGDTLERFEPRTSRPPDPLVELGSRKPLISTIENADQGVLHQVGPIQPLVIPLQP